MIIHIGNGDTRVNFWIVTILHIQKVAVKIQLLVCKMQARVMEFFGKDAYH